MKHQQHSFAWWWSTPPASRVCGLRVPLHTHLVNLLVVFALIGFVRIKFVQESMGEATSAFPLGYHGQMDAGRFVPLSVINWLVHIASMVFSLEVVGSFVRQTRELQTTTRTREYNVARIQAITNISEQIFSILPLMSHALVDVEGCGHLEGILMDWFFFGIRAHTFGIGLALWTKSLWVYLPILYLTGSEVLLFHKLPGIVLSTVSLLATLSSPGLPRIFQLGFAWMAFTPFLVPDSSTDLGHMGAASSVGAAIAVQAFGLIRYEEQPQPQDTQLGTNNKKQL